MPARRQPRAQKPASRAARARAVEANLGATETLADFLATAGKLKPAEREAIIDQALVLIESLFVHLPLKRAMHAIDPVQQLRLLRRRHASLTERAFHDEMIAIFVHLRDLHTNYVLPSPFRTRTAVLPFRIEQFVQRPVDPDDPAEGRRYLVTQVSPTVKDARFRKGVVV